MANESLTSAMLIVLFINLFLWFGQFAVTSINPDGDQVYLTGDKHLIEDFDASGGSYILDEDLNSQLPATSSSVEESTGNIFTDTWSTIKNWVLDSTGISFITKILGAPYSFLNAIGLPPAYSFGMGALWYGFTLLLLIMFMRGT